MVDRPNDPLSSPSEAFDRLFGRLRRHRRLRRTLRGLIAMLAAITLSTLAVVWWMSQALFDPESVVIGRYIAYGCVLAALGAFVLWPALRRIDDMEHALQTERQTPQLDGLLLSAVAMRRHDEQAGNTSSELAQEVLRRTVKADKPSRRLTEEDDRASLRSTGLAIALLVAVGAGIALSPAWLQHGLRVLVVPDSDPTVANPFYFDVAPGDTQGNAGEDQLIIASARGFSPPAVTLNFRDVDAKQWQQLTMQGDREDFTGYLRAVTRPLEYFVSAGGVRSQNYRIDVIVQPTLEGIDVTYHYPEYTGRASQTVSDSGDIRAPRGTRVDVQLKVAHAPDGGRLVLDGESHRGLQGEGADVYRGTLEVESNGRYRVELRAENGRFVAVSPEFSIEALEDALPTVALRSPGRDAQVSSLEEVDVTVEVADDLGIQELELVLSVNGGDEQAVAIATSGDGEKTFQAVKTLYLEERALQPGDLIAYYARARDAIAGAAREDVVTDIYFMEVRPFEREFRDGQSGGGGGGGGGGQQQEQLAAQQRMLVVALYNAVRDQDTLSANEHRLKLDKISAAQARIRARVDAIVRRLEARDIVQLDPGFRQMARELPKASEAMRTVEAELETGEGRSAQTPARTALLHLQRAEAAFRSVRVTRADARGNDSGDLRNLFRLEMDRFRNQYADVRRGQWQTEAERIDKTLEALKELARRQQRELERAQLRNQRGDGQGGQSQRDLAADVERMARELERLSLNDPKLRALAERLRRAADSMREAAEGNGVADSREALRQLREARRQLRAGGRQRLARDIDQAANEARALQSEHEDVNRQLDRAQEDSQARQELGERKRAMAGRLGELREQLQRLSQAARSEAPVRDKLAEARRSLDENQVAENIAHTRRLLEESLPPDRTAENAIGEGLRATGDRLAAAAADARGTDSERVGEAREALRDVVRGLASMSSESATGFGGGADPNRRGRLPGNSVNLRDALRAHAGALRDLRGGLVSRPKAAGDVEDVIAGLLELADELQDSDASVARHAALLEKLQDVDYALEQEPNDREGEQQAFAPRQVQPENQHREIVEAYYRELSESVSD